MSPSTSLPPTSAFNAQGFVFLGARDFYEERIPGGCAAVTAHLEPRIAEFFDRRFVGGGFYDVMPILPISSAAAQALGVPRADLVRENAAWLARRDLSGFYRFIVAMASVDMVASRLPELSLRYFDFGRAEGKKVDQRKFESVRYGIPAPLAEWFNSATMGFVPVALETAGAKNVRVHASQLALDGEAHGVKLVKTKYRITWD